MFEPVIDAIPNIGIIVLLLIGSWQVSTGSLNPGDLVQGVALFSLLAFPMRVVGFFLQEMPRAVVSIERVDRVLATTSAPSVEAGSRAPGRAARGELRPRELRVRARRTRPQ